MREKDDVKRMMSRSMSTDENEFPLTDEELHWLLGSSIVTAWRKRLPLERANAKRRREDRLLRLKEEQENAARGGVVNLVPLSDSWGGGGFSSSTSTTAGLLVGLGSCSTFGASPVGGGASVGTGETNKSKQHHLQCQHNLISEAYWLSSLGSSLALDGVSSSSDKNMDPSSWLTDMHACLREEFRGKDEKIGSRNGSNTTTREQQVELNTQSRKSKKK